MKKTKLVDMTIQEGTLCKRGANQYANITLFKSAEVKPVNIVERARQIWKALTFQEVLDSKEAQSDWWEITSAFETSIRSIMQDKESDQSSLLLNSCMQFVEAAKKIVPLLPEPVYLSAEGVVTAVEAITEDVTKAGKVISSANMQRLEAAMASIKEIMSQMMDGETGEEGMQPGNKCMKPVDNKVKKQGDDPMKIDDILKELGPDKAGVVQKAIDDAVSAAIAKGSSVDIEAITKAVENKFAESIEKQRKENAQLRKDLDTERDLRITKEFNDKAASYKNISVSGAVLKQVAAASPEAYTEMIKTLDATEAKIGENNVLLKELGGSSEVETDHDAKVNKLADEKMAANPGMNRYVAIGKVYEEHPELYTEYDRQ